MTKTTESLHQQIMNLPMDPKQGDLMMDRELAAYKQGHREARHAAAELVVQQADGAVPEKALRMPHDGDLLRAQMDSGADDLDRCKQAIRIFCEVNGIKLVDEEPLGDTYDDLWNALQRIETVSAFLPTMEVRHEGGIGAVTKNIVEAIAAASDKLAKFDEAQKRERILLQALKGMVDEFVKVYPIYYYSEPWAHNRNLALRFAQAVLSDVGATVGVVPEKTQVVSFLRGAGLTPKVAQEAAEELIHYFGKGEWGSIEAEEKGAAHAAE